MSNIKRIVVITGSRAEYGLLYWLLNELRLEEAIELKLIVTGTHLSPYFGNTIDEIHQNGFTVDARVELLIDGDTTSAIGKSVGLGIISFTDVLSNMKPDCVIILGDRFEILSAAQAAFFLKIPVVHIHGGELSSGALDDSIRHAITKLSSLHFVSTERYRKRVIQLGEAPDRVYTVGALGLENLKRLKLYTKGELEKILQFQFGKINFFVAYHPVTALEEDTTECIKNIFSALQKYDDAKIFVSGCNADSGGREMMLQLQKIQQQFPDSIYMTTSFGQKRYLSILQYCDLIIGNSSSAIIEAPSLGIPSINIGKRQEGRIRAPTVIDTDTQFTRIAEAIDTALSREFIEITKKKESPYEAVGKFPSKRIIEILQNNLSGNLNSKTFFDLEAVI